MDDVKSYMEQLGRQAREASRVLRRVSTAEKNAALEAIAEAIEARRDTLQMENEKDLAAGEANGLDAALLDRLRLSDKVIDTMVDGLRQIAQLPDPVGEITDMRMRPSGIQVGKMRVPLGVVGIIYESRPNVTIDAAALCRRINRNIGT